MGSTSTAPSPSPSPSVARWRARPAALPRDVRDDALRRRLPARAHRLHAAVLGGIGNLQAPCWAGPHRVDPGFNDGLPYGFGQKWSQTVVFTILILLMVFKPEESSQADDREGVTTWR